MLGSVVRRQKTDPNWICNYCYTTSGVSRAIFCNSNASNFILRHF